MLNHEESTDLLDSTMGVLEADVTNETPQSGTGVIDQWLEQLRQTDNATEIADTLERVKTQLKSDQINTSELSGLLQTLATQTTEFSTLMGSEGDIAPRLEGLSSALRSLAGQIGNE
ncbi:MULTISPECIES: hypothetical protein [Spirosoma]|uniref:Uncharacterized protein n=1 Tax=Spirosoma sordidisoli TaxID=2502893 RepID=A0A4Q2UIC6_9BACT|nr:MULTISPECIES: hypothetical protein [Spirosoma]RYC68944.1 hypothetical protein EQG79_16195 [Spirosoma sordidisoli]